ncbi:MAG: diguanylate cyclase [Dehalococcoidia bacterium]|nr:diguanylate cyclase [Dehalococcoidia bacterium]
MKPETGVSAAARDAVRRIVLISRIAGVVVILSLFGGALYINRHQLTSAASIYAAITIVVGGIAFVALSTLARLSHAGIIERSLREVGDLSEQLREVAEHDPLTGLYNLRAFQDRLSGDLEAAGPADEPVSLIIADLDNFKLLNDSFGHPYGDEVLRRTARVFEAGGDERAYAARLGGDEFAIVLPGLAREAAVGVARAIEGDLAAVRADERQPATLGSFGIGSFPDDGGSVQALFAAADGRMYSEKHQRKAQELSSLVGASRKLFVRVGAAMRPDRTTRAILDEIAAAAREQFALSIARISIPAAAPHGAIVATAAASPDLQRSCDEAAQPLAVPALAAFLPSEAWIIETPIPGETEDAGVLTLAGLPAASVRPDTPVMLALADLIQAVVANGRANDDAERFGRERDIHIELAHALAGGGTLSERLSRVVEMVSGAIRAVTVSIEGFSPTGRGGRNVMSGAPDELMRRWESARESEMGRASLLFLAAQAPCVLRQPADDERLPAWERDIMRRAGVQAVAVIAVLFDGQFLGILGAATRHDDGTAEGWLPLLTSIADHLAPVLKVALLRDELEESYRQLEQSSRDSLARLAAAAEARDPHTGGHLRRIERYTLALATELRLPPADAAALARASTVHDLGKLKLPDDVLLNPGQLDAQAWVRMMAHPADGERLIGDSPMFEMERCVARWHHERWDGSGYPDGLAGEAIPLAARIVAVADAFDALTTQRPYKPAWPLDRAFGEIDRTSGSLFCPTVVAALRALQHSGALESVFEVTETEDGRQRTAAEGAHGPRREAA